MATLLLRAPPLSSFRLALPFTLGLGLTIPLYQFRQQRAPLRLDSATAFGSYPQSRDASVPITKSGGGLNPAAMKQISLGSIAGLAGGVLVSMFSRTLTLLFGVGIVVVQYAASKGYNIIPISKVQQYVKGVNLRSLINDNAAFKMSFGITFALAAFAEL